MSVLNRIFLTMIAALTLACTPQYLPPMNEGDIKDEPPASEVETTKGENGEVTGTASANSEVTQNFSIKGGEDD